MTRSSPDYSSVARDNPITRPDSADVLHDVGLEMKDPKGFVNPFGSFVFRLNRAILLPTT